MSQRISFPQVEIPVQVVRYGIPIGQARLAGKAGELNIAGSYEWPPDAPAEAPFAFDLTLLQDARCRIGLDWPGLLPQPIQDELAPYQIVVGPVYEWKLIVTTRQDDLVVVSYLTDPVDPNKVEGMHIEVVQANAEAASNLSFVFDKGKE